ncbi:MAG: hypothetical protein WC238_06365, partial [Parcubacteria group bacterium]
MENPLRTAKYFGKVALISLLGTGVFATSGVNAKTDVDSTKQKTQRNFILSKPHNQLITTAGDGILAKNYVHKLSLSPNSQIDLDSLYFTKDGQRVSFEVKDAKKS